MMKTLIARGAVFTWWQPSDCDHPRQIGQRRKTGIPLHNSPDRTLVDSVDPDGPFPHLAAALIAVGSGTSTGRRFSESSLLASRPSTSGGALSR